ncbi:MAG: type II secretion system F family protein [Thaumarchaeota archaeon]|nr:type II secretion system F family protein [Nitrososphaerota archaeon]
MKLTIFHRKARSKNGHSSTMFDRFTSIAYRLFHKPAKRISKNMPLLREEILKSNLHISPEGLIAVGILLAIIAFGIGASVFAWGLYSRFFIIPLLAILPIIVFLPPIVASYGPKVSQSSRANALESELHFVIGLVAILAGAGVSPLDALRRIAKMKLFPAAAKEAKKIIVDIEIFGLDPISAMEKAGKYNPNRLFSEFLYGYTTVLKTGGDFVSYINNKLSEVFQARSTKIKRTSDTIAILAEGYVAITALLGISLFALYQVQALLSRSQGGIENIMLFSFVGVPAISAIFIWLLDSLQPRQPFKDTRPIKAFLASIPAGLAIYLLPIPVSDYLHISLALIATDVAPSILAIRYSRQKLGLEKFLPDFIRDVSQGRKVGLPPEKSIEQLSSENYAGLSKHVRKMGAQLSWGVSINSVILTFTSAVNSWIVKVVGTLMMEVVDLGGGTTKNFIEMANFTRRINDMESERRASLKPYIFVIYLAGIMVIITTFLMVFFMTQPLVSNTTLPTATRASQTVNQLLIAAIFEGWVIGMVAGKMGEGSISDGFKHSLALVVISLVLIYFSRSFVRLP